MGKDSPAKTTLATAPGTYVLLLRCSRQRVIQVGRLGEMTLQPGYYAYVGSALGGGGLRARVGRHLAGAGRTHWHIDHLRAHTEPVEVWFSLGERRREHIWAEAIGEMRTASIPMPGFGSSDCRCEAHLFFFRRRPHRHWFRDKLGARVTVLQRR